MVLKKKIVVFLLLIMCLFCENAVAVQTEPSIIGTSAITVDVDTKEIIYSKNIDTRLYPASITKLVTAMLLSENKKPGDILTYSEKAKMQEPSSLDLPALDKLTAKNAMDAMLLYSANDIAYMIAENISGNINNFSILMNDKVKNLNLKNTNFVTPNGLHDPNHYTTAYDLSVIGREVYNYPWIMDTIKKSSSTFTTETNQEITIKNTNKLLGKDGCIGGKTGYTSDAGRCLLALYERNGRRILGVVLKSEYDKNDTVVFKDMEKIINWSYAASKEPVIKKNSIIKTLDTEYCIIPFLNSDTKFNISPFNKLSKKIQIDFTVKEDILRYKNDVEYETSFEINKFDPRKLDVNTPVGKLEVRDRDTTYSYNIYPTKNFDKSYINKFIIISSISIISFVLLIILALAIKRKRRTSK